LKRGWGDAHPHYPLVMTKNISKVQILSCVKTQHFSKILTFFYIFTIFSNLEKQCSCRPPNPSSSWLRNCTGLYCTVVHCTVPYLYLYLYLYLSVPVPEFSCTVRYLILYCTIPVSVLYYTCARRNCFCTVLQYTELYCTVV